MANADPAAFRKAASHFTTGVSVVTAVDDTGAVCGMTANSFVTVSLSPPTVLVAVKLGRIHRAISATRKYTVSVLPDRGTELSVHFAGRPVADLQPRYAEIEPVPRLEDCIAYFCCEVIRTVDVFDHTLFIAEVTSCGHEAGSPLVFFSSQYHGGLGRPLARGEPESRAG